MNIKKAAIIIASVCALFLICATSAKLAAQTSAPPPNLADALARPIVTVVDKTDMPAGVSKHDYVSYARYYWPDPSKPDGLPYISRDGDHNKEQVARGDHARLWTFFNTVETLTNAWRANHDAAAATRAGEWIRAWLVSPATRMNPNFDYAQIRLGHDNNRGTASGIIDARGFGGIVAAINDLDGSPALAAFEKESLHSWFTTYIEWLMTSKNGMAERAAQNNHGTWFIAQTLPIAIYVGRDYLAQALSEEAKKRIGVQIMRDGSQPQEIRRVDGLGYSVFNLEAYAEIAKAAAPLGVDIWNYVSPGHASLGRAVDFLAPYNTDPSKWPNSQKAQLQPGFLDALIKARDAAAKNPVQPASAHPTPPAPPPSPPPSAPVTVPAPVAPAPQEPPTSYPATAPAATNQTALNSVNIVLQKDGAILINGKKVAIKQLSDMLSVLQTINGDFPVLIKMEPNAPLQTLASVMEACRNAGFNKVTVQTQ